MFRVKTVDEVIKEETEKKITEDWFIREVNTRLKSGRNFLMLIHGPTGSGKSYLGLRVCEVLDQGFNINRVLFDIDEFFRIVYKLPRFSFLLIDEVCSYLDARRFMSKVNILTSYVLETFRFKCINLVFTLPNIKMVDVNVRRLLHCMVFQEDRGKARVYKIKMNHLGDTYPVRVGTFVNVGLPNEKLVQAYEKKKEEMFSSLLARVKDELGILDENLAEKLTSLPSYGTTEFDVDSLFNNNISGLGANMHGKNKTETFN